LAEAIKADISVVCDGYGRLDGGAFAGAQLWHNHAGGEHSWRAPTITPYLRQQ
jgi:hypothetical protein